MFTYSPEQIAMQHAATAWKVGRKWQCLCPSCEQVRDLKQEKIMIRRGRPWWIEPAVAAEDDHTW